MVKSEPPSAEIYLDGDNIGVTPAIITQILPGRYKVKIKMDGYNVWDESVDVKANKETSLTARLQGKDGSIVIESEPTNAKIFIDGNNVGVTPETINNVKPGKYFIEINLDGYETWSNEINVEAEKETSLTAELTTKYGSIFLGSEPTKSKIFLDGIEIGTTPANLRSVPHGKHLIEVRKDGYNVWEKNVNIEPGKENIFTAILQVKTGSVSIKSVPKNAKIYLDGKDVGTTPERIKSIIPGTHEVKVQMDKYDIWGDTINIEAGKENVITVVLQKSTGSLMVESDPANATIFFDGKDVGTTPEIIMSSAKGTHTVEVRMKGYDLWERKVDIEPGTEKSLIAILQLKTKSLNIKSKPSGATIFINGEEAGPAPKTITELDPGTHKVEVRMDGYKNWCENVEVNADKENHITAVLRKLTGSLNIKSEPSNAIIIVNGKETGPTPLIINEQVPGTYMVEAKMDGYKNWTKNIEVSADKENQITAVLQIIPGSFRINSEPSNAVIFIDGREAGTTPLIITDPDQGKHLVEVKMDGYEDWRESVDIEHSKETDLNAVLQLKAGSLSIKSKPSIAVVLIDGKEAGTTPLIITEPSPGTHNVEVKMSGFEIWSKSVKIETGKESTLTAVLQLKASPVTINSVPSDAMILINGKEIGKTPVNITDPDPGTYLVEVRMDGYEAWNERVDIEPGKELTITADLQMKTGLINVNSNPSEATIHIDGKHIGSTPDTITNLTPGMHLVEVKKEGYEIWSESVEVKGDKENRLSATLLELTGSVNISSNPSNAIIRIGGKETGNTPTIITNLSAGKHLVDISMNGYADWKESVDIIPGKEIDITAILQMEVGITAELHMKGGRLNINSEPSNAMIFIGGKEEGATPKILTDIKPGKHIVEVRMEGYAEWVKKINIKKGKEIILNAVLQSITGTVNLESEPTEAMVLLDGEDVGMSPQIMTGVKTGKHEVEVRMDGYIPWMKMIKIKAGSEYALTAVLQRRRGSLMVISSPSNAMVCIQDKKIGKTPRTIAELIPGNYTVEVKHDEYLTWSEKVEIVSDKETTLKAVLQAKPGSISIKSKPSDARILIDGNEVGTTPETIKDLSPGTRMVDISMDGYADWKESVDIIPGKEIDITAILQMEVGITAELHMKGGRLNINSEPSNAMIFIGGKEEGATPKILTDIKPGKHIVEVRMEGYAEWVKKINIKKGEEITLNAVLQSITGTVSLESEPTEAMILLDGEDVGMSPQIMTGVKTGKHEVEVRMDGYIPWMKMIKIKAGSEYALTAVLQRRRGSLMVISSPSNAMICMQDKKIGKTPRTIAELIPGNYTVEVKHDEYLTWSEKVEIVSDKETTLKAVLQAKPGSISIKSKPSDAKILIDGNEAGTTPETINDIECGHSYCRIEGWRV